MAVSRINEAGLNVNQYGNRNIVMNGAMKVAQRGTSATGVGSGFAYPTLDRYKIVPSTSGRATMTQTADGPAGFANCLKLECTTADTSIAAGEYFNLRQSLEGQDVQRLKKGTSSAEKITVSFYVKGNAAATYQCELSDQDNTRYNGQTFAVTTDWTRVILTFDGDTTGALDDDNARSLDLNIWLHAGSTYTGGTFTSNTWQTTDNQRVGSITSFFDSTSRTFFITGLQMEVGDTATDFEHRTFGDDLARCERYFYKTYEYATKPGTASSMASSLGRYIDAAQNYASLGLPSVNMRATPTVTLYNPNSGTVGQIRSDSTDHAAVGHSSIGQKGGAFVYVNNSSVPVSNSTRSHITFEAEL